MIRFSNAARMNLQQALTNWSRRALVMALVSSEDFSGLCSNLYERRSQVLGSVKAAVEWTLGNGLEFFF